MTRTNNKVIKRDHTQTSGPLMPSRELIEGTSHKQSGDLEVNGDSVEYFMERIIGSEGPMDIITDDFTVIEVEGAIFEIHLKDADGTWILIEQGMIPVDIDLYDVDGPTFVS